MSQRALRTSTPSSQDAGLPSRLCSAFTRTPQANKIKKCDYPRSRPDESTASLPLINSEEVVCFSRVAGPGRRGATEVPSGLSTMTFINFNWGDC